MKEYKTTGYASAKTGKVSNYKIVSEFKAKNSGKEYVKLESFGKNPFSFVVLKENLCSPTLPELRPGVPTRICWECGRSFSYAQCKANEGDWSENYCGC